MRKTLALVLTICVGALAVGCEPEKKPPTKVPQSDLGAPAGKDGAKSTPAPTTPPAEKKQ